MNIEWKQFLKPSWVILYSQVYVPLKINELVQRLLLIDRFRRITKEKDNSSF